MIIQLFETNYTQSSKSEEGFTLIEMLVSLSLIGIIAAMMASFSSQFSLFSKRDAKIIAQMEVNALSKHLVAVIESAQAFAFISNKIISKSIFIGTSNNIRFVGQVKTGAYTLGLREIYIGINKIGEKSILVEKLSVRRIGTASINSNPFEIILSENILSLRINFLSNLENDQEFESLWVQTWKDTNKLPRAVKFKLAIMVGGEMATSERIAFLHAAE